MHKRTNGRWWNALIHASLITYVQKKRSFQSSDSELDMLHAADDRFVRLHPTWRATAKSHDASSCMIELSAHGDAVVSHVALHAHQRHEIAQARKP